MRSPLCQCLPRRDDTIHAPDWQSTGRPVLSGAAMQHKHAQQGENMPALSIHVCSAAEEPGELRRITITTYLR